MDFWSSHSILGWVRLPKWQSKSKANQITRTRKLIKILFWPESIDYSEAFSHFFNVANLRYFDTCHGPNSDVSLSTSSYVLNMLLLKKLLEVIILLSEANYQYLLHISLKLMNKSEIKIDSLCQRCLLAIVDRACRPPPEAKNLPLFNKKWNIYPNHSRIRRHKTNFWRIKSNNEIAKALIMIEN